jgi:hypothetical protein
MDEPSWLVLLLLGAISWPVIQYGARVLRLGYRRKRGDDLCGKWYEYNLSRREGELYVAREVWTIKASLAEPLAFEARGEGYVYKGKLRKERNHLLAEYSADGHEESVYCRLQRPAVAGASHLIGLWVGFDFDNELFAGPQLLSRKELDDAALDQYLHKAATVLGDAPVVSLVRKAGQGEGRKILESLTGSDFDSPKASADEPALREDDRQAPHDQAEAG